MDIAADYYRGVYRKAGWEKWKASRKRSLTQWYKIRRAVGRVRPFPSEQVYEAKLALTPHFLRKQTRMDVQLWMTNQFRERRMLTKAHYFPARYLARFDAGTVQLTILSSSRTLMIRTSFSHRLDNFRAGF
ncbi:unnamed protein product [Albugo candida]|uniref:Uncharacterized protein n=1 Tax=Albugo candida TaxID=65357 RepID=A0A024GNE9_9STRA|nr:unnamed protein product [Albugo candida]|eukprot:CCI48045.1 unnamed protein product [Albugo candida]